MTPGGPRHPGAGTGPPANARDAEATDRRITQFVGLGALAYYFLIMGGHQYSVDGIAMFQAAKALVFQLSLRLDPPVRWGRDISVSIWSFGMTLAYVPLLLLWYPLFARFPALQAIP